MKKNLMKKVFAVTLSVAMACSIIPATNPVTASAAAAVRLNTKFKTLKIGAKYKLTLTKNTKNWKVVKATSKAPAIAKVYKTTTKAVKVKGKSEGRTNVIVKLKSGKTTKKLKCKFNVVEKSTPSTSTPTPDPGTTEVKTEAEVKNQDELNEALNDSNIKKITIKTEDEAKFETDAKSYADVDLIVDAPNSDVVNNAEFKSIEIQAIKGETWTENAKGNTLRVLAKIASIIVGKDAVVRNISIATTDAQIKLDVKGGEVGTVNISAKVALTITGEASKPISVSVGAGAKDAEISSAVPVEVEASADVTVNLSKGAEGSKVVLKSADAKVTIDNKTDSPVEVTKFNGDKQVVKSGDKLAVTSPSTGTTTPGVNPGTTTYPVDKTATIYAKPCTANVIIDTGASLYATTGSSGVISGGSLTFGVSGASHVSGAAIECQAVVKVNGGNGSNLGWQDCTNGTTFTMSPLYGVKTGDIITIDLSFRTKATSLYNAGAATTAVTFKLQVGAIEFGNNGTGITLNYDDDYVGQGDTVILTKK